MGRFRLARPLQANCIEEYDVRRGNMKKINSIDYGGKVIGIGLIFLIAFPAALYFLDNVTDVSINRVIMHVSVGIGIAIEVAFFVRLSIELHQDKIINRFYQANPASEKTPQQILDERRTSRKQR